MAAIRCFESATVFDGLTRTDVAVLSACVDWL